MCVCILMLIYAYLLELKISPTSLFSIKTIAFMMFSFAQGYSRLLETHCRQHYNFFIPSPCAVSVFISLKVETDFTSIVKNYYII